MVGKSPLMSKTPSALTAATDGPPTSGRQTRPASAPAKPSAGSVVASDKASEAMTPLGCGIWSIDGSAAPL